MLEEIQVVEPKALIIRKLFYFFTKFLLECSCFKMLC